MKRPELPASLGAHFSVQEAVGAGVTRSRLRAQDLDRPFHGVRARNEPEAPTAVDLSWAEQRRVEVTRRIQQYASVMPANQFFSHVSAAVLWGLPLPTSLFTAREGRPAHTGMLDVGVVAPMRQPRGAGIRGHQVASRLVAVESHSTLNVRVSSPAATWAMLGAVLWDAFDLVALGDAVVRERMFKKDPPPLAAIGDLAAMIGVGRRVGIGALRAALPSIRTRSASYAESHQRMTLVSAGLPEPALNHRVVGPTGDLVAVVDAAYPELKIAIEYEGEHHLRDSAQWAKDIARHEALAALGWIVIRVTKRDLFRNPRSMVARVIRARRSRLASAH